MTWSHYIEVLTVDDAIAREFYQKQAIAEDWTIRELQRQKKTGLFHRLAIGKDKEKIFDACDKTHWDTVLLNNKTKALVLCAMRQGSGRTFYPFVIR